MDTGIKIIKGLLIALLLLPSLAWGEDLQIARMNPYILGGGSAACTSGYTGDILKEGFEGCSADGSTGCDLTWTTVGSGLTYNETLAGTPPARACTKGLRVGGNGSDYAYYDYSTTVANNGKFYVRFSFYINSESLNQFERTTIFQSGSTTSGIPWNAIAVYENSGGASDLDLQFRTDTSSTGIAISVGQWYTVDACICDGAETSNACGQGNGVSWFSIDGGVTKDTHPSYDNAAQRYFFFGDMTASRTLDITFGDVSVDSDGSYE